MQNGGRSQWLQLQASCLEPTGDGSDRVTAWCRDAPERKMVLEIFRTERHEAVGKLTWTTSVYDHVRDINL